ncbi:peptidyl-tRNA hydrolase 2, mitochondrial-like isoform X2 [Gigantopelta aegis]|uniref:peptidyl-tRNA hydrolase 2, mitochondrial-like isoform X2 n=1 Tax=Gigantopelta aegis TaxID=1735272 RepID=UPI001B88D3AC|nr:peptidyl-tRNA hydrolase 2, mitochondrial-like isoform X2 [Gigantopelta aegis]
MFPPDGGVVPVLTALGIGVVVGWILKSKGGGISARMLGMSNSNRKKESNSAMSDSGEYKMVIVVRNDLKMGKGKAAAQCAHAAVTAVETLFRTDKQLLFHWKRCGQPKVVVKVDDEASLLSTAERADAMGLTTSIVRDAGRTQIAPGSKTVLSVGPGLASEIDQVTGHLKLF